MWLALFPTVYLSAGTATALILVGGETMKLFFRTVCGPTCTSDPLTTVEWYLVFTSLCIVLSQLPNLNSIAGLSLVGAVTAVTFTTMSWVLSVSHPRPPSVSYRPLRPSALSVLNALGIIAFAFRGHNLALEIQVTRCTHRHRHSSSFSYLHWAASDLRRRLPPPQATMPSTFKHPAHEPMWRGVKVAYLLIAMCVFPVALGGFWAYGNLVRERTPSSSFSSSSSSSNCLRRRCRRGGC